MTKKLFWDHPYQKNLETVVTVTADNFVKLQETIFYAFSGGQESDSGTIGGHQVLEARKNGIDIEYLLSSGHGLVAGNAVTVEIDWQRRYQLMRLHFAAELILELVYRHLKGVEKIGAHIAEKKARLDFLWPQNIASYFPILLPEAQKLVAEDHQIISAFADERTQRRYWEISGFARVSCGGTHLKRTSEVGVMSLKRRNIGQGKERIEVFVDVKNCAAES
ncbi:MAG: alanyl-tRNA editing protein [Deltaproteobacteria bacterium]|jgi:Ser-tRNA(Ala) deacylase AlaX|nr:alanyl-tRNA editing protein [Deltaproteobacteria bacterium]